MNKIKMTTMLIACTLLIGSCSYQKPQIAAHVIVVKTATVQSSSFNGEQSYSGTIEEMSGTPLSFSCAGTVKVLTISEGQNVRAGQLVGVVDATSSGSALTMAQATTAQARESVKQATDAYQRMKLLHDNGSLPAIKWVEVQTQVSQAQQMLRQSLAAERIAHKGLTDTRLVVPFSGYISKKNVEIGQNVMPGQPVANLVKIDQVKVCISVPEEEIARIRMGQTVQFTISSLGDAVFRGRITEKGVSADPVSRQYLVKALSQNPGHRLLPGMVFDVYTTVSQDQMHISVPANTVQIDIDNVPFVWTVVNGKAQKVKVVGKDDLQDAYKSMLESLSQAGTYNDYKVKVSFINSEKLNEQNIGDQLKNMDGIVICPGFGQRGIEGKIIAAHYTRTHDVPTFGICLGMQMMVIEFAPNVLGYDDANSR